MAKIEIGAGFIMAALSGLGIFQNVYANYAILAVGIILILHGCFDLSVRPKLLLKFMVKRWLSHRQWEILKKIDQYKYPEYIFVVAVEDRSHYRVGITRSKKHSGVLVFHSVVQKEKDWDQQFPKLTEQQKDHLIEEIRVFLASKDMPFEGAMWPLDKLLIERILTIDSHISEDAVDTKAKEVVFAVVGIKSLIRQALSVASASN